MNHTRIALPVALAFSAIALVGCGRKEAPPADSVAAAPAPVTPAMVTVIETGKSIDGNKRIADTTTTFGPNDTMYISVVTSNPTPSTMLRSVVTFQDGQVVDSSSQAVAVATSPGTPTVTEFHLNKPGGWPVGTYTVEVFLDGQSAGTRTLTVKR